MPCLADKMKLLRDLLMKGHHWVWGAVQLKAFENLKQILISSLVLALFNPRSPTVVSFDVSFYGLGHMLLL